MSDKEMFKETFEHVQMSEEAFQRVRNLQPEKRKSSPVRQVVVATVLVMLLFLSGNGIVYAMTGDTLVEMAQEMYVSLTKPLQEEDIYVNGNMEHEVIVKPAKVLEHYMDEEGVYHYVIEANGRTSEGSVRVEGNPAHSSIIIFHQKIDGGTSTGCIVYEAELFEEAGRTWLYIDGFAEDKKLDITEDFADGEATGTFEDRCVAGRLQVETLKYIVKGSPGDYTVDIQWVSAEHDAE